MLHDNNLIKLLALRAFTIYNGSNATKIAIVFVCLYVICFLLSHFYFKLKNAEDNK